MQPRSPRSSQFDAADELESNPQEAHLDSTAEDTAPSSDSLASPLRKDALLALAKRHPATIALIDEITAEVTARTESRLRLATAEIRERRLWQVPVGDRGLVLFGAFACVNLLLVTAVLVLARVMVPWLAALVVSFAVGTGTVLFVLRRSSAVLAAGVVLMRVPFVRRLAMRKFAARLFAST